MPAIAKIEPKPEPKPPEPPKADPMTEAVHNVAISNVLLKRQIDAQVQAQARLIEDMKTALTQAVGSHPAPVKKITFRFLRDDPRTTSITGMEATVIR